MERGWVGRVEDDRVIHLAAQTLQSFFTGGGAAREHDVYPRSGVRLLAPVLHPPAVRVFESEERFWFANPAAIAAPEAAVPARGPDGLAVLARLAAVVGADEELAGYTLLAEWRASGLPEPKDRDFALGLGPLVVTADACDPAGLRVRVRVDGQPRAELGGAGFRWEAARRLAAEGTVLRAGDLLACPALGRLDGLRPGTRVELDADAIGTLAHAVVAP
ncbi:MAG TPA: fumarylacetoacetate hydrolase family protein [Gaiellaceae bacterium]|nr:fumarylacetoacetate hydrolase family protein [Gaiellaceae bacterium]